MFLFALALLAPADITAAVLDQITPVQPIVKGTGLPPGDNEEAQVMAPVDAWIAGVDAGNAAAIAAEVRVDGGGGVTVATNANGTATVRHQNWQQYLADVQPAGRRHERFTEQPAVEIDGDIAMVWGDVARSVGGRSAGCGVDHLDLIRENGRWRVQSLTQSQRTTGCDVE